MHTKLISEYQSLLAAEESEAAFDEALSLARRAASGGTSGRRNGWSRISHKSGAGEAHVRQEAISATVRRILDAEDILSTLPPVARSASIPSDQYSLLMDILLVLFHQAYFVLLPKAKSRRESLLKAFGSFAESLPNHADRFQVNGLIEIELGRPEAASDSFRAALAATHSDQHDFLSRLQMIWSFLMDRKELSKAFACLQDAAPRVTRIDFDEFQGLYAATFEEAQRR